MRTILFSILCLLFLVGCQSEGLDTSSAGPSTQITDPDSRTTLTVSLPKSTISTAERILVQVDVQWAEPNGIELVEPVWAQTQWSLIQATQDAARVVGAGFVTTHHFLIEPFLPGEYTIPVFKVEIMSDPDESPRTISTMPIALQVNSVLAAEDAGELAPIAQLYEPEQLAEVKNSNQVFYWSLGGGLVLSGLMIYLLTRPATQASKNKSAYSMLEEVARLKDGESPQAYETLYQALSKLDPRLQQTSEIRVLIELCERIRFSHDQAGELDAKLMARHTLDLLGESHGDSGWEAA